MKKTFENYIGFSVILCVLFLTSCYKEIIEYPDTRLGYFNFLTTPSQEYKINHYHSNLTLRDTLPTLLFDGKEYGVDRFEVRGESSLDFWRKSFSVNLDNKMAFFIPDENQARKFEKIKLISLVFDYTYIENCIAIGLFTKINLWPTYDFYTEVQLNNHTQGVYLFIEDPEDYFLYQLDASFILRRHYDHQYKKYELNKRRDTHPEEYYLAKYYSIYSLIAEYDGEQLYDSLMKRIDLSEYFSKLAIDLLLRNGDCTDEVYLYTKVVNGREIFGVYPWDYDDLFEEFPHEIGRIWGMGTVFGTRAYYTMNDVIADVGEKLIFSIEDDLDYKIAKDTFLYSRYLDELEVVISEIINEDIEEVMESAHDQLQPFYNVAEIIEQSTYDQDETNQQLFDMNLAEKRQMLLDRRAWIIKELGKRKK
jgi:hypothetical protein